MSPGSTPPSSAQIFFQSLFAPDADAFAMLQGLVSSGADENGWREFKDAGWYDSPPPDEAERKRRDGKVKAIWSESLSAFGNSGGGLLIWGINAPNRHATGTSLPQDAERLVHRLRDWLINAVEPPVLGVEIRAVRKPGGTSGFVVCIIPASAFVPHCGNWALGGYYVRGQDSNVRMRTEVLRRMFYPQIAPRLVPLVRLQVQRGDNRCTHTAMRVELRNDGSGSAKGVFLDFNARGGAVFTRHVNANLWKPRYHFDNSGLECLATIHPNETVLLLGNLTGHGAPESTDNLREPIECTFWIFAENMEAIRAEVRFEPEEMLVAFNLKQPIDRVATLVAFQP